MRNSIRMLAVSLCFAGTCHSTAGQDLPRSGSISWHTGWKIAAETMTVAEGQLVGHGSAVGTSFNDKGAGPLHLGAAECVVVFSIGKGPGSNLGYCAFGDADGDRIFTEFSGKLGLPGGADEGVNVISGGTGKYAGITGRGPWKCKSAGGNGGTQCAQRLDYRLP